MRRVVSADPDGPVDSDWIAVVVPHETGVRYQHQYGGTACRQMLVEGYLVPLSAPDALSGLRLYFEGDLNGTGTWNYSWPSDEVDRVAQLVGLVAMWESTGEGQQAGMPLALSLDVSRLGDADEAHLPVLTPDGAGWLIWNNSD